MLKNKINILKRAVRRKVFSGSEVLRKNNNENNVMIIPSKKYPTQIINRGKTKYIRINEDDIKEDIDNLLSTMLGMGEPNTENIEDEVKDSYKLNKELDGIEINIPDNLEDLPIKLMEAIDDDQEKEKQEHKENREIDNDLENEDIKEAIDDMTDTISSSNGSENSKDNEDNDKKLERKLDLDVEPLLEKVKQMKDNDSFMNKDIPKRVIKLLPSANKLAKQLVKALKGKNGKSKSINPSKRISTRDVILNRDKIYVTKKMNQGKEIEMNLIIDMSGSMWGEPIENAVLIIYIFNQLAKQGLVKMHVIYSQTDHRDMITLPVDDSEILIRNYPEYSEGLKLSLEAYATILKNKNLICITDGMLADEPINHKFWQRQRIVSTGVYVRDTEDIREYSKSLNKWFTHSLVRPTLESLIQTLVRIGLR